MKKSNALILLHFWIASGYTLDAQAQAEKNYPQRQVQWVVPFLAGSNLDVSARLITQRLSQVLSQPFVVDNRTGAGGNIGAEFVIKATPDGYTLLQTINSLAAMPALYPTLSFDPVRDLAPIVQIAAQPYVMAINPSEPASNVAQFVSLAKGKPDQFAYGSSGSGSLDHLAGALFASMTGTKMLHVPYKGGPAVQNDLMAGRINMAFTGMGATLPLFKAGKLRPLAVTSSKRAKALPDVPTMMESGLTQYELVNSYALYAPARTPQSIVGRLNEEMNRVLNEHAIRERFEALGVEVLGGTSEELGAKLRNDVIQWKKVVDEAGIRP